MTVPSLPPLPPRSAAEIVDGAVQLIRPQFGYFLRIAAIGAIPSLIQTVAALLIFPTQSTDPTVFVQEQLKLLPLTLLAYAFTTAQSGAIVIGALAALRGDALPSVWSAFTAAFRRIFALLGANLLLILALLVVLVPAVFGATLLFVTGTGLAGQLSQFGTVGIIAIAIGSLLGFVGILFVMVSAFARSAVMTALVVAEQLGPVQALRRSHALSSGNYLLLARTYALVGLIILVVYAVMAGIATAFRGQQQLASALVSLLIIPVTPIIGGVMLLTYADLRVRREGADLDAELDALSGAAVLAV